MSQRYLLGALTFAITLTVLAIISRCTQTPQPDIETIPQATYSTVDYFSANVGVSGNVVEGDFVSCGPIEITLLGDGTFETPNRTTDNLGSFSIIAANAEVTLRAQPTGNKVNFSLTGYNCKFAN